MAVQIDLVRVLTSAATEHWVLGYYNTVRAHQEIVTSSLPNAARAVTHFRYFAERGNSVSSDFPE